jgi:cell division septation protein DedD
MEHPQTDPSLPIENGSGLIEAFDQSVHSPMSFELYDDGFKSELREDEDPYAREQPVEARLPVAAEDRSFQLQAATPSSGFEARLPDKEKKVIETNGFHPSAQVGAFGESPAGSLASLADLFHDQGKGQHVTEETPVRESWEDPLPAWDYSQNEWPVLVGPQRKSTRSLKATLAVVVPLGLAVAIYIFMHQPVARQPLAITPSDSSAAGRVPAPAEPKPSTAQRAESDSQSRPASSDAQAPASVGSEAATPTEDANAHGKFSLQAAAFPTQAGADQFADKLRSAGVPSYRVNTDLGRRGTWYRVRIGRFNTAEDAQKFASEAQRRANTVGMSLQLMVCQYEQP